MKHLSEDYCDFKVVPYKPTEFKSWKRKKSLSIYSVFSTGELNYFNLFQFLKDYFFNLVKNNIPLKEYSPIPALFLISNEQK